VLYEYIDAKVIPITTKFFGSEIIKNDSNGIVISKPYHENLIKILENIVKNPKVIERYIESVKKTKVLYDNEEFDKILNIYQKLCK
jgi:Glycosyl transferases group 1.